MSVETHLTIPVGNQIRIISDGLLSRRSYVKFFHPKGKYPILGVESLNWRNEQTSGQNLFRTIINKLSHFFCASQWSYWSLRLKSFRLTLRLVKFVFFFLVLVFNNLVIFLSKLRSSTGSNSSKSDSAHSLWTVLVFLVLLFCCFFMLYHTANFMLGVEINLKRFVFHHRNHSR